MSQLIDIANRLRRALERACAEHGAPNTFSYGELQEYGCPAPMLAGRSLSHITTLELGAGRKASVTRGADGRLYVLEMVTAP